MWDNSLAASAETGIVSVDRLQNWLIWLNFLAGKISHPDRSINRWTPWIGAVRPTPRAWQASVTDASSTFA
jgi:hypothetical protein